MFQTSKKSALVTGASSGMGKEIAKRLIRDGYQVYVAARRTDDMEDLRKLGAEPLRMDISVEADIVAVADVIQATTGGVDLLVNNAGFGLYGPMEQIPMSEARYQFEVNVFGPARLTQLLLPAMRSRKRGRIINITSMGGKIYTPLGSWYHATKHALEGWSDCLRLELAPFGIDVVVEPGLIETAFGDVVGQGIVKRSEAGPYAGLARAVAEGTSQTYGRGRNSPPRVIANVVSRAARARRPKTRYVAGRFGSFLIGYRAWFGDRAFDSLVMGQLPRS
ncbi:MAG: oxidoreductase [Brevundimonas sp.]|uniref:oxidoreductase n=1 Tax=Brevundimonas sp. TaxID=1871086 RepID=UPI002718FCED|nr:oxidoreductase [Brevundimonas sp.]MDO9608820.1 oxidoreductase [Brevundimonas sp.]